MSWFKKKQIPKYRIIELNNGQFQEQEYNSQYRQYEFIFNVPSNTLKDALTMLDTHISAEVSREARRIGRLTKQEVWNSDQVVKESHYEKLKRAESYSCNRCGHDDVNECDCYDRLFSEGECDMCGEHDQRICKCEE